MVLSCVYKGCRLVKNFLWKVVPIFSKEAIQDNEVWPTFSNKFLPPSWSVTCKWKQELVEFSIVYSRNSNFPYHFLVEYLPVDVKCPLILHKTGLQIHKCSTSSYSQFYW